MVPEVYSQSATDSRSIQPAYDKLLDQIGLLVSYPHIKGDNNVMGEQYRYIK